MTGTTIRSDSDARVSGLLRDAIASHLHHGLPSFIPTSPYRSFLLWGLDAENPHRGAFLQCLGITQLAKMTASVSKTLVQPSDWQRFAPLVSMNSAYLCFEIMSDNLALHLAPLRRPTEHAPLRRALLERFNELAQQRLRDPATRCDLLQEELKDLATGLSWFEQSLVPDRLRALADVYVKEGGDGDASSIECAVAPMLHVNIETCRSTLRSVAGLSLFELTQRGLIDRYRCANRVLRGTDTSLMRGVESGLHTALVVPTLYFYIDVLAHLRAPSARLVEHREAVSELVRDAAVQIRLLNDLGTQLLTCSEDALGRRLDEGLRAGAGAYEASSGNLRSALLATTSSSPAWTRVHKDIEFGEFSLALWGIDPQTSWPEAVGRIYENVDFCRSLYESVRKRMQAQATKLRAVLPVAVEPVRRLLDFNVEMYRNDFTTQRGEYSI